MMKSFYTILAIALCLVVVLYCGLYYFDALPIALQDKPCLDSFERVWHVDTLQVDTNFLSEPPITDTTDFK